MNGQNNMDTGLRWAVIIALILFLGPVIWPVISFIGWCLGILFGIAIALGLVAAAIYLFGLGINKASSTFNNFADEGKDRWEQTGPTNPDSVANQPHE